MEAYHLWSQGTKVMELIKMHLSDEEMFGCSCLNFSTEVQANGFVNSLLE